MIVQAQPNRDLRRLNEVGTISSTKQEDLMIKVAREDQIVDEAIHWFVRLRAEDKSDLEHDRFFDWLFESSKHQTAFSEILTLWDSLEIIKSADQDDFSTLNLLHQASCRIELSTLS